ncbi:hypothetical protein BELL_0002g00290 [Botrytis elliptica]|uniref:Fumarylacetoacetase-like C-terminal domain-containing protein n=1 Tax=Botrytis elliptica TaxID=278938 RepID=A0A4Z1KGX0_9HELO|nr:hypothetical protein BELL_0002g00290 [Botrytis elliptica]
MLMLAYRGVRSKSTTGTCAAVTEITDKYQIHSLFRMDPSLNPSPPKLQIAHVLADLNILKQAPPRATLSFLRSLSTVSATIDERKTSIHSQPTPKFDRLGRRIPTPSSVVQSPSPPLRKHSSMDSIDLPETEESIRETRERRLDRRRSSGRDEEFMRAKTLLAYYNNRHKLQEKGQRGMKMSQERVDKALHEHAEKRQQLFFVQELDAQMQDHITELNNSKPKQPFFFLKPPSSILPPNGGSVIRPKGVDLHYEVELALIMGKQVKNLEPENEKEAYDSIESYAMSIDMTARNAQNEAKKKGLPWDIAKGFDTFLPMSNIISKSQIPDPHNATVWLTVNNEHRQKDSTELMLYRIPRILSDISKVMTLEKGDIVLTGTPKGVGSVKPGDVMRVGISVGGKELEEGKIEVAVEESTSTYQFKET